MPRFPYDAFAARHQESKCLYPNPKKIGIEYYLALNVAVGVQTFSLYFTITKDIEIRLLEVSKKASSDKSKLERSPAKQHIARTSGTARELWKILEPQCANAANVG